MNKSISQSRSKDYTFHELLSLWSDYFKQEPQKLVLYINLDLGKDAEEIGRVLGVVGQVVRDKYLTKEKKEAYLKTKREKEKHV